MGHIGEKWPEKQEEAGDNCVEIGLGQLQQGGYRRVSTKGVEQRQKVVSLDKQVKKISVSMMVMVGDQDASDRQADYIYHEGKRSLSRKSRALPRCKASNMANVPPLRQAPGTQGRAQTVDPKSGGPAQKMITQPYPLPSIKTSPLLPSRNAVCIWKTSIHCVPAYNWYPALAVDVLLLLPLCHSVSGSYMSSDRLHG
ncbi:hypothetical protein BDZ89DRAFT_1116764 [Hymenopellis radicata]|nr:hypothetical protein BDZ89DRAFT_1116764 [Hymenopellis radicata]